MSNFSQAETRVLVEAVRRRARFVVQLQARMEKTGRGANPLYAAVRNAAEAMYGLWVDLHFRACGVPDAGIAANPGAPSTSAPIRTWPALKGQARHLTGTRNQSLWSTS